MIRTQRGKHWRGRRKLKAAVAQSLRHGDDTGPVWKIIHGSLRNTIHDHGPITLAAVDGATKRIIQQLRGWCYNDGHGREEVATSLENEKQDWRSQSS